MRGHRLRLREDAAELFYTAAKAQDGAEACAQLSEHSREQLEKDEGEPCAKAVLGLR